MPTSAYSNLCGVLLVNKPSGPTSYDLIRWLKRGRKGLKIGHCGTLDPLASGLMILLLGRSTKNQSTYMHMDKTYFCGMQLGTSTDTGDTEGSVTARASVPPLNPESIERVFGRFLGSQSQIPPMFSALKKDGVPLYKLARQGKIVERAPRPVVIHDLSLVSFEDPDRMTFRVRCSSGTYVRTLVEDIGKAFGVPAVLTSLVRESIGAFTLEEAIAGEDLPRFTEDELHAHLSKVKLS